MRFCDFARPLGFILVGLWGLCGAYAQTQSLCAADVGFKDLRGGWGWSDRCLGHLKSGKLDCAEAACTQGLKIAGSSKVKSALRYNQAKIAEARGNTKQAHTLYREARGLRKKTKPTRENLAFVTPEVCPKTMTRKGLCDCLLEVVKPDKDDWEVLTPDKNAKYLCDVRGRYAQKLELWRAGPEKNTPSGLFLVSHQDGKYVLLKYLGRAWNSMRTDVDIEVKKTVVRSTSRRKYLLLESEGNERFGHDGLHETSTSRALLVCQLSPKLGCYRAIPIGSDTAGFDMGEDEKTTDHPPNAEDFSHTFRLTDRGTLIIKGGKASPAVEYTFK